MLLTQKTKEQSLNLDEFIKEKTVIIVALRRSRSAVKNADQIIVIDEGKVVETINHTSLIKKEMNILQPC